MTPEQIVLIFALFGSAKVALELIVTAVKFATKKEDATQSIPQEELVSAVAMLESMSLANESLRDTNAKLLQRIDDLDAAFRNLKSQSSVKRSRSAKTAVANTKVAEAVSEPTVERKVLVGTEQTSRDYDAPQFYLDTERFEVI